MISACSKHFRHHFVLFDDNQYFFTTSDADQCYFEKCHFNAQYKMCPSEVCSDWRQKW